MRMMAVSHEGRSNGRERTIADGASIELQIRSARERALKTPLERGATNKMSISILSNETVTNTSSLACWKLAADK